IGFAVGMERLISLLPKERDTISRPHLFIAALSGEPQKEAYRLVNQFHLEGIWAELDYEGKSLKSQMRRADKLRARYTLILGDEEIRKGKAILRDMDTHTQEEVSISDLLKILKERVSPQKSNPSK
ncbi:MAG: His/Gly/Thr/Pro-type tRNA ligase C-terminal domain-containing protein, partial [Nitrososphaeria archaeon]